ncbi:cellulase family glycosylhydrolase [Nakamurella leprariae]|uniref:Endoglucanase n=1 Tax=Nakamurella leprariae TaxID=2803911 RepID=A0A939C0R9_9ACTN|nr:cellulase family glycosylhydrolase [Nakamurella leprariae]MBM9469510.1 cellulase family glycosylhydrolase [Nakamurella leprariae]
MSSRRWTNARRDGGRPPRTRRRVTALVAGAALVTTAAVVTPAFSGGTSSSTADAATPDGWLHTDGARIVTQSGDDFRIRAVNWFGLETSNCAPHGLWQISLDQGLEQIASFGFNTIRLPFSNECLHSTAPASGIDATRNPELVGRTGQQVMDAVVAAAQQSGLRIILDRHRPDSGSQSELWYTDRYPESVWIEDWQQLAQRYAGDPTVIGVDLHNEPHGPACWGCGDPAVDWAAAATRAGNAVLAVNSELLILVEGVQQQAAAGNTWWGGGLADAADHPIILDVADRVVYAPHDYPASISGQPWFSDPAYPANLPAVWDRNWGHLAQQDIAPVLLGEFGTRLQTDSDRAWLTTLVDYLQQRELSFAYWSFNPNSGDTGGLVGDDWTTPEAAKLAALAPLLAPTGAPATPDPTTPDPPTPTPSTPDPTTSTSPTTPPTMPAPAAPTTPTTQPPTDTSPVTVDWQRSSAWPDGYVANLVVRPTAGAVSGWQVSWADPAAVSVVNAWGMQCQVAGGRMTCTGSDWARAIPDGGAVHVGLQVQVDGAAPDRPVLTTS